MESFEQYERQMRRIDRLHPVADEWISELERHLRKWGRSPLLAEHLGYAFAAFAKGMEAEECCNRIMDIDEEALREQDLLPIRAQILAGRALEERLVVEAL